MSSLVIAIFLLSIGASFVQRTTDFGFGYIVYAYIAVSGVIILLSSCHN